MVTVPAYSSLAVEAAMNLWEAVCARPDTPDAPAPWARYRENVGSVQFRHDIMDYGQPCADDFARLSADQQEAFSPYDWEYCPFWLAECIDWSNPLSIDVRTPTVRGALLTQRAAVLSAGRDRAFFLQQIKRRGYVEEHPGYLARYFGRVGEKATGGTATSVLVTSGDGCGMPSPDDWLIGAHIDHPDGRKESIAKGEYDMHSGGALAVPFDVALVAVEEVAEAFFLSASDAARAVAGDGPGATVGDSILSILEAGRAEAAPYQPVVYDDPFAGLPVVPLSHPDAAPVPRGLTLETVDLLQRCLNFVETFSGEEVDGPQGLIAALSNALDSKPEPDADPFTLEDATAYIRDGVALLKEHDFIDDADIKDGVIRISLEDHDLCVIVSYSPKSEN